MDDQLQTIEAEALATLKDLTQPADLSPWYRRFLGRKGTLTTWLQGLRELPPQERPRWGQAGNALKKRLQSAFDAAQERIQQRALAAQVQGEAFDVTMPGRCFPRGSLHPSTQMLRRIRRIFAEMGFQVFESREVESEAYNFDLLNIPPYHPARDMWDTFWLEPRSLVAEKTPSTKKQTTPKAAVMRTHTSPGQIRAMRAFYPEPIRVILPGKVYRYEAMSARAEHQFFQVEGLVVGKRVRMSDLIGVMQQFARRMYGGKRKIRIRSSYFPFTEPSIEIDVNWDRPGGVIDKNSGWLEIAGAGMIHPDVLQNGGYNPEQWNGFAFGIGVERPAMLFHGIDDIRLFYRNDLRFLRQF